MSFAESTRSVLMKAAYPSQNAVALVILLEVVAAAAIACVTSTSPMPANPWHSTIALQIGAVQHATARLMPIVDLTISALTYSVKTDTGIVYLSLDAAVRSLSDVRTLLGILLVALMKMEQAIDFNLGELPSEYEAQVQVTVLS